MTRVVDPAIVDGVRDCMRRILGLSAESSAAVDLQTTPLVLPQWTSLAHLQLILELERRFDVVFAADDIAALASMGTLAAAVERLTLHPRADNG
jgi:acyl carrier protein